MIVNITNVATLEASVGEIFDSMDEGERCHMANKLFKEGVVPIKQQQADEVSAREWDILEGACDFWKATAIDMGYDDE
jgi:hypothetical protein